MPKPGFFNFKEAADKAAHVLLPQLYNTSQAFTASNPDVKKDAAIRAAAAWLGTAGVIVFIISQHHPELDIHGAKESIASLLNKTTLNLDAQNFLQVITYIALLWVIPKTFECIAYIRRQHPSSKKMEINLDDDEPELPSQSNDDLPPDSIFNPNRLDQDYFKAHQVDAYTDWDNRTTAFARASKIRDEMSKNRHDKHKCIIL